MGGATLLTTGTVLQAYGTYTGYEANKQQSKYAAEINRKNIAIGKERIKDVKRAGLEIGAQQRTQALHVIGDQISAFASSGIDISSAVVGEKVSETALTAASNMIKAQKAIDRQVWGLELGILNEETQEILNKASAKSAGIAQIIGTTAALLPLAKIKRTPTPINPLQRRFAPRGVTTFNPNVALDLP